MSNQPDTSIPARLVGDGPATAGGTQASIGDLTVSKSGESILFMPRDAQGQPLAITGIRNSNDSQVLQVAGVTRAATCTLGFAGATTAPIPLQPIPPLSSFVYRATLPRPGSYDIGLSWGIFFGGPPVPVSNQALVEVYSSGKRLGSTPIDQTMGLGVPSDVAVQGVGVFRPAGTFQFAGTDLEVRLSGVEGSGLLLAGTLRVAPTGSADPNAVGFVDLNTTHNPGSNGVLEGAASTATFGAWDLAFFYTAAGSWHAGYIGTAAGTAATGFLAAADVEKALLALPSVSPGSIKVSAPTTQALAVEFTGQMGNQPWPTMTCSEPAIRVLHDGTSGSSIGGDFPSVTINGVPHLLRAASFAPGRPRVAFHLIQDAPAVQYLRYGEGLYQNNGWFNVAEGVGFGNRVGYATAAGLLAAWRFQGLPGPAEFQVDVTWPGGDPNGDVMQYAVIDGSGAVLKTITGLDQSQAPGDSVDAAGVPWKSLGRFTLPYQVNALTVQASGAGTAGKHAILDSVRLTRTSPDRGARIRPGDKALFALPTDFVRTTAGSVPAVAAVPLPPIPATRLPAIPPGPKALKLGFNCDFPVFWGSNSCYANMAVQAIQPIGLAQDASGNPVRLGFDGNFRCGSATSAFTTPVADAGGRGYGMPTSGPGTWVLQWTSSPASSCLLEPAAATTGVAEIAARRTTTGRVNRRYFQVTSSNPSAPGLQLRFLGTQANADGSYQCDVTDVAVFPPDVDPDSPSRWRPGFLKQLRGAQCFRFMDMLGTNDLNLSSFAHFPDQAHFPLGYGYRTLSVPIASIGPPTPDPFAEAGNGVVVRVTTKVPHGIGTGFIIGLRTTDGSSLGQVTANTIDAKTGQLSTTSCNPIDPTDGYRGAYAMALCHVIDDTTIQIGIEGRTTTAARMTNTLTPANAVVAGQIAPHTMMGPADVADLCVASGLDAWVNVPWLADDDCVRQMARLLAQRLPAGRVVHVEYGNEPWNFNFAGWSFSTRMAKLLGFADTSYVPYYMTRMGQVHRMFRDAWAAAGRDPAQVRRVCGVQEDYAAGTTTPCLAFAMANGITFDELSPASYYNNAPASGPLDDLLTREQLLDLFAMNMQQSDLPGQMAAHAQICRDALAQNPAQAWLRDVVLVNYEGGPDTMTTPTMTANITPRNHAVHRHPDFCEIELHHLQMLEDAGVKLFNIFTLYGVRDVSQWGVYEGYLMEPGTGDATVDTINVDDFENLPAIKSETAAALMKWTAMTPQGGQPGRPAGKVLRNGTARAYGGVAY